MKKIKLHFIHPDHRPWKDFIMRQKISLGISDKDDCRQSWEILCNCDSDDLKLMAPALKQIEFLISHEYDLWTLEEAKEAAIQSDKDNSENYSEEDADSDWVEKNISWMSSHIFKLVDKQKKLFDSPTKLIHTCFTLVNGGWMNFDELTENIFCQNWIKRDKLKLYWDHIEAILPSLTTVKNQAIYNGISNAIWVANEKNHGYPLDKDY